MMKMTKKVYLLIFLAILLVSGCQTERSLTNRSSHGEYQIRGYMEFFHLSMFRNGRDDSNGVMIADTFETGNFLGQNEDITFLLVDGIEEANQYSDELTVPTWPNIYTDRVLFSLNHFLVEEGVDVSEFNLAYPITTRDVIDHWEDVDDLRMSLERAIRSEIMYFTFYIDRLLSEVEKKRIEQLEYAVFWEFTPLFRDDLVGYRASATRPDVIRSYAWHIEEYGVGNSEIVFVYSREEAASSDVEEVFVVYLEGAFNLESRLETLNSHIEGASIDLGGFSLVSPIMKVDLIDNWESVNELMGTFEADVLDRIRFSR